MANPHCWFMTADNLYEQAVFLKKRKGRSFLTFTNHQRDFRITWDGANRATFLIGGFALENAIKAFLVYENPNWISNGKLARHLRSHSLTSLQKQSSLIPYKNRYLGVLRSFEAGLESWARYPCGLAVEYSELEPVMPNELWDQYLTVMSAYGNRLEKLLSKGWHGPHGFYGKWTFSGEFLRSGIAL